MPNEVEKGERELTPYEKFRATPIVELGGRRIDLSRMPPFLMGQKRRLEKQYGIKFGALVDNADAEAQLLHFILHEIEPDLRLEELDNLPVLIGTFVVRYTAERAGEIDRPFSTWSISSPASTDGGARKSTDGAQPN